MPLTALPRGPWAIGRKLLDNAKKHIEGTGVELEKSKGELDRAKKSKASLETLEQKNRARAEGAPWRSSARRVLPCCWQGAALSCWEETRRSKR